MPAFLIICLKDLTSLCPKLVYQPGVCQKFNFLLKIFSIRISVALFTDVTSDIFQVYNWRDAGYALSKGAIQALKTKFPNQVYKKRFGKYQNYHSYFFCITLKAANISQTYTTNCQFSFKNVQQKVRFYSIFVNISMTGHQFC